MLKVAMLALGATLTLGALAPQDASAQLSGRERSEAAKRGGVIVPQDRRDDRIYDRRDDRCYDDDRYDTRRDDDDRYRGKGKHEKNARKRDDRRDRTDRRDDCDDDRYRYGDGRDNRGNGPPFCRNGQGHPVHGREWCRQKGWENASLRNVDWRDVILRRPRYDTRNDLGRNILLDILGRSVYNRFDSQRSRLGLNSGLVGRWQDTSSGSMLNLYSSGIQVGQVLDRNRDGRADLVLLNYGR
jgi:hypothetical protein